MVQIKLIHFDIGEKGSSVADSGELERFGWDSVELLLSLNYVIFMENSGKFGGFISAVRFVAAKLLVCYSMLSLVAHLWNRIHISY